MVDPICRQSTVPAVSQKKALADGRGESGSVYDRISGLYENVRPCKSCKLVAIIHRGVARGYLAVAGKYNYDKSHRCGDGFCFAHKLSVKITDNGKTVMHRMNGALPIGRVGASTTRCNQSTRTYKIVAHRQTKQQPSLLDRYQ